MKASKPVAARTVINRWKRSKAFMKVYDALESEFALARAMIAARSHAKLTQEQLARRMATTQAVVARWESGRVMPSTRTLAKLARATGTRLQIAFSAK